MVHPNIFRPRNDWNMISFNCRKGTNIDYFENQIAREIKSVFGIDIHKDTNSRNREFVEARQVFIALMVKYTKRSQASIGRIIGKDHATVIHAIKTTKNLYDTDRRFREMYEFIDNKIRQLN